MASIQITTCHTLKQVKQQNAIWHCFWSQIWMPFQMVCSALLTILHHKTLLLIGCEFSTANQEPTNTNLPCKWVLMAMQRENAAHYLKEHSKLSWKLVSDCLWHFVWLNLLHDKKCFVTCTGRNNQLFFKQALPTTSVRPDSRASLGTASPVPSLASTSGGGGAAAAGMTTITFFTLAIFA